MKSKRIASFNLQRDLLIEFLIKKSNKKWWKAEKSFFIINVIARSSVQSFHASALRLLNLLWHNYENRFIRDGFGFVSVREFQVLKGEHRLENEFVEGLIKNINSFQKAELKKIYDFFNYGPECFVNYIEVDYMPTFTSQVPSRFVVFGNLRWS